MFLRKVCFYPYHSVVRLLVVFYWEDEVDVCIVSVPLQWNTHAFGAVIGALGHNNSPVCQSRVLAWWIQCLYDFSVFDSEVSQGVAVLWLTSNYFLFGLGVLFSSHGWGESDFFSLYLYHRLNFYNLSYEVIWFFYRLCSQVRAYWAIVPFLVPVEGSSILKIAIYVTLCVGGGCICPTETNVEDIGWKVVI